jgi:hypothetical protein
MFRFSGLDIAVLQLLLSFIEIDPTRQKTVSSLQRNQLQMTPEWLPFCYAFAYTVHGQWPQLLCSAHLVCI